MSNKPKTRKKHQPEKKGSEMGNSDYSNEKNVLQSLNKINDLEELEYFIQSDNLYIQDFFINQNYSRLKAHTQFFDEVFVKKYRMVKRLDLSKSHNRLFVLTLLEASERLSCYSLFESFYKLLQKAGAEISLKHRAVARYIINIRRFDDFIDAYDEIIGYLTEAYETEEDNIESVVAVFLQYYSKVIIDFGRFNNQGVKTFHNTILGSRKQHFILNNKWIDQALSIGIEGFEKAFDQIQCLIDKALSRTISIPAYHKELLIIEKNTPYAIKLARTGKLFNDIKEIAINEWLENRNDDIFHSLGRGVNILTEEAQLFSYIYSYGNLHQAKLLSAFDAMSFDSKTVEIVDWGCGQGIAALLFFEIFNHLTIEQVILIEPSEIALKRASLHLSNFNSNIQIKTICKTFDRVTKDDIYNSATGTKIHLFSNILDVDSFSLPHLQQLIARTQKGINYFVCVSPYISDLRTERLNGFQRFFKNQYPNSYELISEKTYKSTGSSIYWNCNNNFKGSRCFNHDNRCGCDKKWSRVERIFSVKIN